MHPESLRDHSLFQGPTAPPKAEGFLFGALAAFAELWEGAAELGPLIMIDELLRRGLETAKNNHVNPTSSESAELNELVGRFTRPREDSENLAKLSPEQAKIKELFVAFVKDRVELVAHLVPTVDILRVLFEVNRLNVSYIRDALELDSTKSSDQSVVAGEGTPAH